jgi:hypothetical protein
MAAANPIINGDKGTWGNFNDTELEYTPTDSNQLAVQRIQKNLGDVVKDNDGIKIVNAREINRKDKNNNTEQKNILSYNDTEPIISKYGNKNESAKLKDRRYKKNGENYDRTDTHYTATTKGNQKISDRNGSEVIVNYDIPISDDSVAKNNQDLLQIFDQGLNNIILEIKSRFGNDNEEVNKIVSAISSIFGNIDTIIKDNDRLGTDSLAENDYEHDGEKIERDDRGNITKGFGKAVSKKDVLTGEYTSTISGKHMEETEMPKQFDYVKDIEKFKGNLDFNSKYDVAQGKKELNLNIPAQRQELMTRLNNCQALEIFHLKLFENFMKTGAFTLTLYEKYKYITTVMLYLLKNLVNKPKLEKDCSNGVIPPTIPIADTVILPKTVIKNIGRLVEEQNRIQGTINTIDTALKQTKLDDVYGYASEAINANLNTETTPHATSVPNAETSDEVKNLTPIPPHVTNRKSQISDDDINRSKEIQDPQPVANKPAPAAAAAGP